ncbi:MAG TPA: hypothetical protein VHV78_05215, partial [Gemmatimonadaceae bacterium]|jgi:hypothetical protein|nr:hypothetical protein [Gemmatimonadaceae bacterium]
LHRPRAAADTLRAIDHRTLRSATMTLHFTSTDASRSAFTLEFARVRGVEFSRVEQRTEK